jgi:F-type H+-transporting ATPase subunit beta
LTRSVQPRVCLTLIIGEEHYNVARDVQGILQRYKSLQDIIAILGMDELSEEDKLTVLAPVRSSVSCRSHSTWPRSSPALTVFRFQLEDTIASFKAVVAGEYDHLPEAPSTWLAASLT